MKRKIANPKSNREKLLTKDDLETTVVEIGRVLKNIPLTCACLSCEAEELKPLTPAGTNGGKGIFQTSDAQLDTDTIEDMWRTAQHTSRAW